MPIVITEEMLRKLIAQYAKDIADSNKQLWGGAIEIDAMTRAFDEPISISVDNVAGARQENATIHLELIEGHYWYINKDNQLISVNPDGSCLFHAVLCALGKQDTDEDVQILRRKVADIINSSGANGRLGDSLRIVLNSKDEAEFNKNLQELKQVVSVSAELETELQKHFSQTLVPKNLIEQYTDLLIAGTSQEEIFNLFVKKLKKPNQQEEDRFKKWLEQQKISLGELYLFNGWSSLPEASKADKKITTSFRLAFAIEEIFNKSVLKRLFPQQNSDNKGSAVEQIRQQLSYHLKYNNDIDIDYTALAKLLCFSSPIENNQQAFLQCLEERPNTELDLYYRFCLRMCEKQIACGMIQNQDQAHEYLKKILKPIELDNPKKMLEFFKSVRVIDDAIGTDTDISKSANDSTKAEWIKKYLIIDNELLAAYRQEMSDIILEDKDAQSNKRSNQEKCFQACANVCKLFGIILIKDNFENQRVGCKSYDESNAILFLKRFLEAALINSITDDNFVKILAMRKMRLENSAAILAQEDKKRGLILFPSNTLIRVKLDGKPYCCVFNPNHSSSEIILDGRKFWLYHRNHRGTKQFWLANEDKSLVMFLGIGEHAGDIHAYKITHGAEIDFAAMGILNVSKYKILNFNGFEFTFNNLKNQIKNLKPEDKEYNYPENLQPSQTKVDFGFVPKDECTDLAWKQPDLVQQQLQEKVMQAILAIKAGLDNVFATKQRNIKTQSISVTSQGPNVKENQENLLKKIKEYNATLSPLEKLNNLAAQDEILKAIGKAGNYKGIQQIAVNVWKPCAEAILRLINIELGLGYLTSEQLNALLTVLQPPLNEIQRGCVPVLNMLRPLTKLLSDTESTIKTAVQRQLEDVQQQLTAVQQQLEDVSQLTAVQLVAVQQQFFAVTQQFAATQFAAKQLIDAQLIDAQQQLVAVQQQLEAAQLAAPKQQLKNDLLSDAQKRIAVQQQDVTAQQLAAQQHAAVHNLEAAQLAAQQFEVVQQQFVVIQQQLVAAGKRHENSFSKGSDR